MANKRSSPPPVIDSFNGKNYFLSNFYESDVEYEGIVYPTNEHAFQAAKTHSALLREFIASLKKPGQAKHVGNNVRLRRDWESVKDDVMFEIVVAKFEQSEYLCERLINTGDAMLIEGNNWGDDYWGCVKRKGEWKGLNILGTILMEVREELRHA